MNNKYKAVFSIVLGVLIFVGAITVLWIFVTPFPWLVVFGIENPLFFSVTVAGVLGVFGAFLVMEGATFFLKEKYSIEIWRWLTFIIACGFIIGWMIFREY